MAVTIGVISVLALASGGVIRLVSRAAAMNAPLSDASTAAAALARLRREVSMATAITSVSASGIVFQTMLTDNKLATIEYSWTGKLTDNLIRRDASGVTTLARNIKSFVLAPLSATIPAWPQCSATSEAVLDTCGGTGATQTEDIDNKANVFQILTPTLPAGAISWSPTRIRFYAARNGPADTSLQISLRAVSGGVPSATALSSTVLPEASLPVAAGWVSVGLPAGITLTPATDVGFWFTSIDGKKAAQLTLVKSVSGQPAGAGGAIKSTDGGAKWTGITSDGLWLEVYGTCAYSTTGAAAPRVTALSATLSCGLGGAAKSTVTIPLLNAPVLP
ncbi:hypothetical protein BH11PLA1_BH11PLA1_09990 [soil metagenome]